MQNKNPWNRSPNLLLLGAKGRMASFFSKQIFKSNFKIHEFDIQDQVTDQALAETDVLWISVPMETVVQVAKEYGPKLRPDALICDINSLKLSVVKQYNTLSCNWLSLHPMFGPFVEQLEGQKIIACQARNSPQAEWILSLLTAKGCAIHRSSAETHDQMMAFIQVLIHFNKMVVASTLMEKDKEFFETLNFTSPIYRLELAVIARMFAQSANLYAHIQTENPFASEVRACFVKHAGALNQQLDQGNTDTFNKLFEEAHQYFHGFSEEGLAIK